MTKWIILAVLINWIWKVYRETKKKQAEAARMSSHVSTVQRTHGLVVDQPLGSPAGVTEPRFPEPLASQTFGLSLRERLREVERAMNEAQDDEEDLEPIEWRPAPASVPSQRASDPFAFHEATTVYDKIPSFDYNEVEQPRSHFHLNRGMRKDAFSIGTSWDDEGTRRKRNDNRFKLDRSLLRDYVIMHEVFGKPRAMRPHSPTANR